MLKLEKRAVDFVRRHALWIFGVCIVAISLVVRFMLRRILVFDMEYFLIPWVEALRKGGIAAVVAKNNFDYNAAYLLLLYAASFLPINEMAVVKLVSCLFDYLAATAMGWAAYTLVGPSPNRRIVTAGAFIGTVVLPIPLANSAMWGQCDMVYTLFLLLSLIFLIKENYPPAVLLFSLALCFKLQAIFFLPVLGMVYLVKRGFSILHFLSAPVLLIIFGLFVRTEGDSIFKGLEIYAGQTQTYPQLYVEYPNLYYSAERQAYEWFAPPGILFAMLVLVCMLLYVLLKHIPLEGDALVLLTVWCVLTCVHFLPAMHDRYAFAAELLVWLFFIVNPGLQRFALALAVNFAPLLVYVRVLLGFEYLNQTALSLVNVLVYVAVSVYTVLYLRGQRPAAVLEE